MDKQISSLETLKKFLKLEFPEYKIDDFSESEIGLLEEYAIKRTKKESDFLQDLTKYYDAHPSFATIKVRLQELRVIFNRKGKFGTKSEDMSTFLEWWCAQKNQCCYCGIDAKTAENAFKKEILKSKKRAWKNGVLQIERLKPDDGEMENSGYIFENCALACVLCNNAKSDLTTDSKVFKNFFGEAIKKYWDEWIKCKLEGTDTKIKLCVSCTYYSDYPYCTDFPNGKCFYFV